MKKLHIFRCKLFVLLFATTFVLQGKPPRLTVIIVIDQFAHHYLHKIEPHLTGGIAEILQKGTRYTNAYIPHSNPATSCGHTTLSTGVYPKSHGIIGNYWYDTSGKLIRFEKQEQNPHKVFSPNGTYSYGASSKNIMVDNLSDQFAMTNKPNKTYTVYALSYKSRAAIGMGGKLGKAIWFDHKSRSFTSSKAYFEQLPEWLKTFNQTYNPIKKPPQLSWTLFFQKLTTPYEFYDITNYTYAAHPFSLLDKPFHEIINTSKGEYGELYIKTPHANQLLIDLAKTCLENELNSDTQDQMLLWISFSPLDPLGHYYGPYSKEVIDLLYHLDWQLKQFLEYLKEKVGAKNLLLALTADHGVMPIIEILQEKGVRQAHRINPDMLIKKMNRYVHKKYGITSIVTDFQTPQFYLDKTKLKKLDKKQKHAVLRSLQNLLEEQPGIQSAWTYQDLANLPVQEGSINELFKNQLYPGRSGDITCKCQPYSAITNYPTGTHHRTPYEYDTHVPLALYWHDKIKKQIIHSKVLMTQFANTIAKLCDVPKPSASTAKPLPGI